MLSFRGGIVRVPTSGGRIVRVLTSGVVLGVLPYRALAGGIVWVQADIISAYSIRRGNMCMGPVRDRGAGFLNPARSGSLCSSCM